MPITKPTTVSAWTQESGRQSDKNQNRAIEDQDSEATMAPKKRPRLNSVHDRRHQHRDDCGEHENEDDVGELEDEGGSLVVQLDHDQCDQQVDEEPEGSHEMGQVGQVARQSSW